MYTFEMSDNKNRKHKNNKLEKLLPENMTKEETIF